MKNRNLTEVEKDKMRDLSYHDKSRILFLQCVSHWIFGK